MRTIYTPYTYKGYRFIITDHNEYTPNEYHIWHITHYNDAKLKYPMNGTTQYGFTYEAYNAAKLWIDNQKGN